MDRTGTFELTHKEMWCLMTHLIVEDAFEKLITSDGSLNIEMFKEFGIDCRTTCDICEYSDECWSPSNKEGALEIFYLREKLKKFTKCRVSF